MKRKFFIGWMRYDWRNYFHQIYYQHPLDEKCFGERLQIPTLVTTIRQGKGLPYKVKVKVTIEEI